MKNEFEYQMRESKLSHMTDPLREMLFCAPDVLRSYRERTGMRLAGLSCDFLPAEVIACFGAVPVRIPAGLRSGNCGCGQAFDPGALASFPYDFYVQPAGCCALSSLAGTGAPVHEFRVPAGYGEAARELLHDEIVDLMKRAGAREMDGSALKEMADEYNALRRLMRGILSVRAAKPSLLSQEDVFILVEAASVFPPETVIEPLALILRELNAAEGANAKMVPAMVYGGFMAGAEVLDLIEEEGVLVSEDDLCGGRRQFDLSINTSADDLLTEILDAFTYRPFCPQGQGRQGTVRASL